VWVALVPTHVGTLRTCPHPPETQELLLRPFGLDCSTPTLPETIQQGLAVQTPDR
jgi:hypothetical protein